MNFGEVLTTAGITVEEFNARLFSEYLGQTFWSLYMGTDDGAIIHVNEDFTKKKGDRINFTIRSEIIGGKVTGTNQGTGNEGEVEFYNFQVTVDEVRQLVKYKGVKISDQRVAFNLINDSARPALEDKVRFDLEDEITVQMSDTSAGRVQGRYRYGATEGNYNADHATALATIDNTNDKLTTILVEDAKIKARIPVNAHARMRPWKVQTMTNKGFQEWFTMVSHTYAMRDMVRDDASWKNAQLNLPPMTNRESPIFTGTSFKGAWDGVLLYEWDRVQLESSTVQVAHNLFMGAQAGVLAWAMRPQFGQDSEDVGHTQIFELDEIRGVTKVVWDRSAVNANLTNEDNSVQHVFTAAVAS